MRVSLDREAVEILFEKCTHQGQVLEGLYRMVFPEWDRITSIKGYPRVNRVTWGHIAKLFFPFDKKHHPDCMPGGAWMNTGFGSLEGLADWEVDMSECVVKYVEVSENLVEIV